MSKKVWIGIGGLAVCGIVSYVALSGGGSKAKPAAPAPAPAVGQPAVVQPTEEPKPTDVPPTEVGVPTGAPEWIEVLNVSGNGMKKTEDFTVTGKQWRISWNVTGDGYFGASIYTSEGNLSELAANCTACGSDSTIIRGAGTYYLDINSTDAWRVTVEDMK